MQEYKITSYTAESPEKIEEELNKLASEGWEIINISWIGTALLVFWKKK